MNIVHTVLWLKGAATALGMAWVLSSMTLSCVPAHGRGGTRIPLVTGYSVQIHTYLGSSCVSIQ